MTAFVLVHGAWQGASTWDRVVPLLQTAGYEVHTPTLKGLGTRSAELNESVTLEDHVADVLDTLVSDDLSDVILVGHSYAGMAVTAVAEKAAKRLRRIVYVDAFVPRDGDSAIGLMPERFQVIFREQAQTLGGGWRLPGLEKRLDLWGLAPGPDRDFVRERLLRLQFALFRVEARRTDERGSVRSQVVRRLRQTGVSGPAHLPTVRRPGTG